MKVTQRQNGVSENSDVRLSDGIQLHPCDRAADWEPLLYDYAEGLADEETGAAVQRHLEECAYCRGAFADIRWMTLALRQSVPEPKTDLGARVMETIRAQDDLNGRVFTEQIDVQTGRVLSSSSDKRGIRRLLNTIGYVAASLVLIIGLFYAVPLLRAGGGASSSGTQEILLDMQSGAEDTLHDGVVVGTAQNADEAVTLQVSGITEAGLAELLSQLTVTLDGYSITVMETDDGFQLTPLSALAQVTAMLVSENLQVTAVHAETASVSPAPEDAFYIQIREPQ